MPVLGDAVSCSLYSNAVTIGTNGTPSVTLESQLLTAKSGTSTVVLVPASATISGPDLLLRSTNGIVLNGRDISLASNGLIGGYVKLGDTAQIQHVHVYANSFVKQVATAITETASSFVSTVVNAYNVVCGSFSVNANSGSINLTTTGTITLTAADVKGAVPWGTIVMTCPGRPLPSGWALCDGRNGTPDLRGRFVLGANPMDFNGANPLAAYYHPSFSTSLPSSTGGSEKVVANHTHTYFDTKFSESANLKPSYLDNYTTWPNNAGIGYGGSIGSGSYDYNNIYMGNIETSAGATGSNGALVTNTDTRPPYYALVYIMKLQ